MKQKINWFATADIQKYTKAIINVFINRLLTAVVVSNKIFHL